MQFLETATNNISSGMASIQMATSGCKHNGKFVLKEDEIHYANANFDELIVEMANGDGEILNDFATVMGCGSQSSQFKSIVKEKFPQIYESETITPNQMLINIKSEITCNTII